jgi:hypothetical protein
MSGQLNVLLIMSLFDRYYLWSTWFPSLSVKKLQVVELLGSQMPSLKTQHQLQFDIPFAVQCLESLRRFQCRDGMARRFCLQPPEGLFLRISRVLKDL